MIELENLSKRYGDLVAVDDLSLSVPRGCCLGLLGPNGAGKTTTIGMMIGLIRPDAGRSMIDGGSVADASVRRRIGIAPQKLALYDELTADENLNFFADLYGIESAVRTSSVDAAIEAAGLQSRRGDRVAAYSGGMKRRLNLAVAMVHDPDVLLLDEPTVGVDPQSRNHLFDRIAALKADGRTIIYTTHYMEEVTRLCDRVAIVDHGRLLDVDTADGLIRSHAGSSMVVADLADDASVASIANLPGEVIDRRWTVRHDEPFELIARASADGVRFESLKVERPNLEDVFLNLTGRTLRDA